MKKDVLSRQAEIELLIHRHYDLLGRVWLTLNLRDDYMEPEHSTQIRRENGSARK